MNSENKLSRSSVTLRELLHCDDDAFNPLNMDTKEIQNLSSAMPADGNIDLNNAEVLAVKYLRGADMCSELMAIATRYLSKTDSDMRRAYNRAFIKFKDDRSIKTDKMRVAYAELDDDYIYAQDRNTEAKAFHKWVESKYNSFNKMHYMCKKLLDRGYQHEAAAGFNGNTPISENDTW